MAKSLVGQCTWSLLKLGKIELVVVVNRSAFRTICRPAQGGAERNPSTMYIPARVECRVL